MQPAHTATCCSSSLSVLPVQPEVKASISQFMSFVHTSSKEMSKIYLAVERRYNYTTPKTFLEQIKLYQNLLADKRSNLSGSIDRLEKGLMKLRSTASQVPAHSPSCASCLFWAWHRGREQAHPCRMVVCDVPKPHNETLLLHQAGLGRISPFICSVSSLIEVDDLKAMLAVQEIELKQKNEDTDKLIHVVGVETEKVSKEKAIADEEELKVEAINKVRSAELVSSVGQGSVGSVLAATYPMPRPPSPDSG